MQNLIERTAADLGARSSEEEAAVSAVLSVLRARRSADMDGFVAPLDERAIYHEVPFAPAKGSREARARAEAWCRAVPDLEIVLERVVVRGGAVVCMGRVQGTLRGALFGLQGSGMRFDLPFAQLALVRRGKITYVRDHWDLATLMREVGWAAE